jgi:hypothetical protein
VDPVTVVVAEVDSSGQTRIGYTYSDAGAAGLITGLFDGVLTPQDGALVPDASRPGLGIELKRDNAERFRV